MILGLPGYSFWLLPVPKPNDFPEFPFDRPLTGSYHGLVLTGLLGSLQQLFSKIFPHLTGSARKTKFFAGNLSSSFVAALNGCGAGILLSNGAA